MNRDHEDKSQAYSFDYEKMKELDKIKRELLESKTECEQLRKKLSGYYTKLLVISGDLWTLYKGCAEILMGKPDYDDDGNEVFYDKHFVKEMLGVLGDIIDDVYRNVNPGE